MPESPLLKRLRDSELLTAEQLDDLARCKEARESDPRALAKHVLERGWLTRYQINQIAAGRGKELQIAQYILLDRVGEGGMGQVFKARHAHMGRIVALKLMRKEKLGSAKAVERFFIEVQAAAKLTHPNIVIAFDAGRTGNAQYFSMEYVDGPDLAQYVRKTGPLPIAQACDFIRQAALGLAHAHEQGMVHRDIKPGNLLVTGGASPVVKILDMGLVRVGESFEKERERTKIGKLLGTPDYLAPEQAIDASKVDVRADIYSLGCTLFYLLTGRAPFRAESLLQLLHKHQNEPPPPLRSVRPDAPPELDALLGRMMAKKPEQRPASASEVAATLEPMARGERVAIPVPPPPPIDDAWAELTEEGDGLIARAPVRSGRDRFRETIEDRPRRRRRGRRNLPLLIGGSIGAAVLLIATTIFAAVMLSKPDDSEKLGLVHRDKTNSGQKEDDPEPNVKKKVSKEKEKAKDLDPPEPEPRPAIVERSRRGHVAFKGHRRAVLALAVSPDGTRAVSGGVNRSVFVWDLVGEKELYRFDHLPAAVRSLAFLEDGNRLVASVGNSFHEWDLSTGKTSIRPGAVNAFLSPDGKTALSFEQINGKPMIRIWDVQGGKEKNRIDGLAGNVLHAFDRDSKRAVAIGKDGQLMRIDLATGQVVANLAIAGPGTIVLSALSFGPGENEILAGRSDGFVHRLPWFDGARTERIQRKLTGTVRSITLAPDDKTILATCDDNDVHMFDVAVWPKVSIFGGHKSVPQMALFCLGGRKAVSADRAGTVMLLDLARPTSTWIPAGSKPAPPKKPVVTSEKPKTLDPAAFMGHTGPVRSIAVSPDGKYLLSGSEDRTVQLWDAATGKAICTFMMRDPMVIRSVCFTRDGKTVLAVGEGKMGYAWDTESGKALDSFLVAMKGGATSIAVSPNDEDFAVASADAVVGYRIYKDMGWHAAHNRAMASAGTVNCVASVDDGSRFALGSAAGTVRIADVRGTIPVVKSTIPLKYKGIIRALAVSRGRQVLAAAGSDKVIFLTSLAPGIKRPIQRLEGHEAPVTCLAVSPDGQRIVSGSRDRTIRVWDLQSRNELFKFTDDEEVLSVAFAGDGTSVFWAGGKRIRMKSLIAEQ
jgi:serine/threonine protein kinase/WD40 repeat protein